MGLLRPGPAAPVSRGTGPAGSVAGQELVDGGMVAFQRDGGCALPAEVLRLDGGRAAHVVAGVRVVVEGFEGVGPVRGLVAVHQQPGPAVLDGAGQPANPRGHHGGAAGLRFKGHEPEGLAVGRHDDNVGRAVPARQLGRADRRVVGDDVVHSGGGDQRLEVEVLGAAQRPEDGELQVDVRTALAEQGGGLEQDLGPFQPLDAAGEDQVEGARQDAVRGAGAARGRRG